MNKIAFRVSPFIYNELTELAERFDTNLSVIARAAIVHFIRELYEQQRDNGLQDHKEEEQHGKV